ncbi:MAG: 1-deoxy-D-xylulose-5-phosphate reductoisomerase [Deltaproteobacteria bacterium]|jgi:1-deoxy-D-xylulose-5-phosphate reductoisomerase|nr:1-deoxy-D-xylulose-5-phosphate reductoisomerase [Deltaproteobacteria bacterium]
MAKPISLAVLGSTGSIGRSALALARAFPDKLTVAALAARQSLVPLADQILEFRPAVVSVADDSSRQKLLGLLAAAPSPSPKNSIPEILVGPNGLNQAASASGAEAVLSAVVGAAGLPPTHAALSKGLKVCLANKESLVLGGEILMALAGDRLSPVDSEHSAIFQALGGKLRDPNLDRLILTASGGPFRGFSLAELQKVTREQALNHPTWSMGPKITCDSATMMNKGLEVIEAHHLFGLDYDRIEILVHPKSYVHSLAGFRDGSILAQMGPTDMKLAIAYALSHPERWPLKGLPARSPEFVAFADQTVPPILTFEPPDRRAFKALALAERAGRAGGSAPATLNAANEIAVEAFLAGAISFTAIADLVELTLAALPTQKLSTLDDCLAADRLARRRASELLAKLKI